MQYCSLKDAFPGLPEEEQEKINSFVAPPVPSIPSIPDISLPQAEPKESFQLIEKPRCLECEKRSQSYSIDSTFNEILNIVLILILLYIIIYKPSI